MIILTANNLLKKRENNKFSLNKIKCCKEIPSSRQHVYHLIGTSLSIRDLANYYGGKHGIMQVGMVLEW